MARNKARGKRGKVAQFKAALALAGITAEKWATSQDVTTQHLSAVLRGDRDSARLTGEIDAFIAKHLPQKAAA